KCPKADRELNPNKPPSFLREGETESDAVVSVDRFVPRAIGRATARACDAPGTTAHDAIQPESFGIHHASARQRTTVPILAPFPDIAVHVVNAEAIRRFLSHGMGFASAVFGVPG